MVEEKTRLLELRERMRWIGRPTAAVHGVLPFGIAAIDRVLPGGGLALGALHEILGMSGDEEDGALAAAFAAGILGRLGPYPASGTPAPCFLPALASTTPAARIRSASGTPAPCFLPGAGLAGGRPGAPLPGLDLGTSGERRGGDTVLWCLPRPDLYGPGLAAHGLDPRRLVLVRAARDAEILWAMEEGLRAPGIAAVVGEVRSLPAVASRRLQLAAERYGITAFLLRRWRDGGQAARERNLPNAAVTRWRIAALSSQPLPGEPGVGRPRWRVELVRCRGGEPACWEVEEADATGHVSLASALADRPAAIVPAEKFRRAG